MPKRLVDIYLPTYMHVPAYLPAWPFPVSLCADFQGSAETRLTTHNPVTCCGSRKDYILGRAPFFASCYRAISTCPPGRALKFGPLCIVVTFYLLSLAGAGPGPGVGMGGTPGGSRTPVRLPEDPAFRGIQSQLLEGLWISGRGWCRPLTSEVKGFRRKGNDCGQQDKGNTLKT